MMRFNILFRVSFITVFGLISLQGCGNSDDKTEEPPLETLPMNQVSLESLNAFEPTSDNWQIYGGIESDYQTEHDLTGIPGTGILVNNPTDQNNDHLFTSWTHGDLELEIDFLMPKESNSGIYLMGRYEVQLLDSWGVEEPMFSDVGGIYQRWNESQPEGQKGFEGNAPRLNAARAPGLWQHLKILFKAPEFDQNGEKISNAIFEEVWLNGVLVQEGIEVSGPTRAAYYEDEQPAGPLMIQGDHGPVAVKNIEYKRYDKKVVTLEDLSYEYFATSLHSFPEFDTLTVTDSGRLDSLSGSLRRSDDRYAIRFNGTLRTPNQGTYLFKLQNAGTVRMAIDGEYIFNQEKVYRMHELESRTVELDEGTHEFTLEYIDHPNNWYRGLGLYVEGPRLRLQKLHASNSVPGGGRELPDLLVQVDDRAKIIRSFALHGDGKRTHVVNVGSPNGIHYNYDMGQAALLHAWDGPFLNANEMWINRGEPQIAKPSGPAIEFSGKPVTARFDNERSGWPDSVAWDQLNVKGYSISNEDNLPIFKYTFGDVEIEDKIEGFTDERRLRRTVHLVAQDQMDNIWLHLASGVEITQSANEYEYVVDDRSFYLRVVENNGSEPRIVESDNGADLRIPLFMENNEATISYDIIW